MSWFPYLWPDVLAAYLVSALPLAWWLAGRRLQPFPRASKLLLASIFLGLALVPLVDGIQTPLHNLVQALPSLAWLLRPALALCAGMVLACLWPAALPLAPQSDPRPGPPAPHRLGVLAAAAWLLIGPAIYGAARSRHDAHLLAAYVDQSRFGEARALAARLAGWNPSGTLQDRPIAVVRQNLDRIVADLEARLAASRPDAAAPAPRLDRARCLAMLGKTQAALACLHFEFPAAYTMEAANLRGAILEASADWAAALAAYQRAHACGANAPAGPQRQAGLAKALTGMAFCQRKLGRYAAAESAYLTLLQLSPQASTHFLLAQFYEDAQQADCARRHVLQAMRLHPRQFQALGEKLLERLAVRQFGCLGVFGNHP